MFKKKKTETGDYLFYLLTFGVFLILISSSLLSEGMFMDGLIYATISRNLAEEIGTFWNPYFTETLYPSFHEHPPLAFAMQAVLYYVFGDTRYIDKLYSLLTFIITGIIVYRIWKFFTKNNGWLPILIWGSMPLVTWTCPNNMLENTLMIFTSLAVLFYLKNWQQHSYWFIALSGISLTLGFLTKGFVAFFPLTLPVIMWVLFKRDNIYKALTETAALTFFTIAPLILLITISPTAANSLYEYFEKQVIGSIESVVTVDSRFYIIWSLLHELITVSILFIILALIGLKKRFHFASLLENSRLAFCFFLLGLSGVLPIMVSMKQRGFYILATLPFFAIALALVLNGFIEKMIKPALLKHNNFLVFKLFSCCILTAGIGLSLFFSNKIGRDQVKIQDMHAIISVLPKGTTINIAPALWDDWSLHGYYARYNKNSFDPVLTNQRIYLLLKGDAGQYDGIIRNYQKIDIETTEYQIYKINNIQHAY